jgi:hypothetical protein
MRKPGKPGFRAQLAVAHFVNLAGLAEAGRIIVTLAII